MRSLLGPTPDFPAFAAAVSRFARRPMKMLLAALSFMVLLPTSALAQSEAGGEASLKLPDLSSVSFYNGTINGHNLLMIGLLFCVAGLAFGMVIYHQLKNLPVHRSMREISELI